MAVPQLKASSHKTLVPKLLSVFPHDTSTRVARKQLTTTIHMSHVSSELEMFSRFT